jgi:hypothetical protein
MLLIVSVGLVVGGIVLISLGHQPYVCGAGSPSTSGLFTDPTYTYCRRPGLSAIGVVLLALGVIGAAVVLCVGLFSRSEAPPRIAPPGWYPVAGHPRERWWDGRSWGADRARTDGP